MTDAQELEKRIKALEDGSVDINKEVDTCKAISASNSKWYKHQGIVTISILALILTVFSTFGYFAGKDFIKRTVKDNVNEYAKEEVQSMLDGYKKDIDAKLDTLDKEIDNLITKAEEKKIKMVVKLEDKLPTSSDASEKEFKIRYDKGEKEFNNKNYLEAIIFFTEAKNKAVSSNHKAYSLTYRGAAYFHYGNYPEAIADFNEAIGFQIKEHALPYYNKGLILSLDPSKYEEAINNLKKAIEVNPKFRDSYAALYTLYKRKGDDENTFRMRQKLREFAMDDIKQLKNPTEKEK